MSLPEENLIGYVIMGEIDPDVPEAVARLLYNEFRITQKWFPLSQCIEHCKESGVDNPKVYTLEEFLKVVPRIRIDELPKLNQ
jgi:hypothetical protein